MYKNKRLKPKLLDPIIEKKIIKTLKPPQEDYWAPTKNSFQSFFQNYIRPNVYLIIFIIIICLLLLYRYRVIKNDRENKLNKIQPAPAQNYMSNNINFRHNSNVSIPLERNYTDEEYADLLLHLYNQQKEDAREPKIKHFNNRMMPVSKQVPKLAYPLYPYSKGGTLAPSSTR